MDVKTHKTTAEHLAHARRNRGTAVEYTPKEVDAAKKEKAKAAKKEKAKAAKKDENVQAD